MHTSNEVANRLLSESNQENAEDFVETLKNSDGIFTSQEDTMFDYKLEFPHSMSDPYFIAIVRLILAFHNSFGGVVVVGVNDATRTSGHNKKIVNIERLNTRLRELSGVSINVVHISVGDVDEAVELLIVPKRSASSPPVKLLDHLGKYQKGTIWLRQGHEVLEAESKDVWFLFSPRSLEETDENKPILSFLPPNPALIKNFVGRIDILSELLTWVVAEDEPRKFLCGRGGSGKSTAAFEFAKLIRDHARSIDLFEGHHFDRVVFLSAKEKSLRPTDGKIIDDIGTDFSTLEELLHAMIEACSYSDTIDLTNLTQDGLLDCLKEIFEHESVFFVIDDIDTLSTKRLNAGFDLLYKMCLRSSNLIRILYTQRNPPAAIENAIEVVGFTNDANYHEFIQNCCELFKVEFPTNEFMDGRLKIDTEGIPLILETIVGLRKSCGDYEKALDLFLERKGSESRKYLFEREYQSLPRDDNARNVLAAIAEFGRPVTNSELARIVQIGDSGIADSIASLVGFFLSTEISDSGETNYFLNTVTSQYIKEKNGSLKFAPQIIERVKSYKAGTLRKSKELFNLERDLNDCLRRNEIDSAYSLFQVEHPPQLTENPEFRKLRAEMYLVQNPPKYLDAREDFNFCVQMGFEDVKCFRTWFWMERKLESPIGDQIKICNYVINGKSYAASVKNEFLSLRAGSYFHKARNEQYVDAFSTYSQSLIDHAKSFSYFWDNGFNTTRQFGPLRSTLFALIQCGQKLNYDVQVVKVLKQINQEVGVFYEPFFDPLILLTRKFSEHRSGDDGKRRKNILLQVNSDFESGRWKFHSAELNRRFIMNMGKPQ